MDDFDEMIAFVNADITKEEFEAYERVRLSGKYNMLMDWKLAMADMKLNSRHRSDKSKYATILGKYEELAKKYLNK